MTPVRLATRADEPEIMRLLLLMHEESGMQRLDNDKAKATFARAFDRQCGIIGVIGRDDEPGSEIHAMIYLMIVQSWYTTEDHLEEIFNFVAPDYRRGTKYGETLIGFGKQCAERLKIPLLIGVFTNHRMAAKVRLYRHSLGYPAGAFFVHNAVWQNEPAGEDFWRQPFPNHHTRGGKRGQGRRQRKRRDGPHVNGGAAQ